ncbi:MAG TPA: hypothetical protein VLT87_28380 [Thermoanaerobaculia bacterium]|nr:hypothetical protein [Thermoanaerobaculia bacterium]
MPQLVGVQILAIKVNVDSASTPPTIQLSGDISDGEIRMPQGINIIIFILEDLLGEAEFPTYPIEWLKKNDVKDTDQPRSFLVERMDARHCMIVDFNCHPGPDQPMSYKFNILATIGGKTYGTDPTIINEPPGGGD